MAESLTPSEEQASLSSPEGKGLVVVIPETADQEMRDVDNWEEGNNEKESSTPSTFGIPEDLKQKKKERKRETSAEREL